MSRVSVQWCAHPALVATTLSLMVLCLADARAFAQTATPPTQSPQPLAATPPPAAPPPPPPFQFSVKGTVAGTVFLQDTATLTGNGTGALLGPLKIASDGWFLGGDVRQSRLSFNVRGPEVLGAIPSGTLELEMFGGQQITTVPAPASTFVVRDAMGMPIGTATGPGFVTTAQSDESLLPRARTAFVELNWNAGENIVRIGQYHNLLLAMVSASAGHPATLGYGGGQLGWRSPGITYSHRFMLSAETILDVAVQMNRNSWADNVAVCPSGAAPPAVNCLPYGVSLGEAGLPQFQGRLMLMGGREESPFPHYAPTVWQAHIVGHWDQKDLSGIGNVAVAPLRDAMDTWVVEAGGKLKLGPVLIAANGWYGQNAGNVYGNLFQMAAPDKQDVKGFGVWSQLGVSFTKQLSLWFFFGIDQPDREDALAAAFTRIRNIQLSGMFAYVEGPLIVSLEWFRVATTSVSAPTPPAVEPVETTTTGNQPSVTVAYSF